MENQQPGSQPTPSPTVVQPQVTTQPSPPPPPPTQPEPQVNTQPSLSPPPPPTPPQPQPQQTSIYPTPTSGMLASTPQPSMVSANSSLAATDSSFNFGNKLESGSSLLSLILGGLAVAVLPLLIFVPRLIGSMTMVTVWLVIVSLLSAGGVAVGIRSRNNSEKTDTLGLMGIILSTIMLVNCVVIGSYYIKIQMTLNSYKSKFKSNSSLNDNY